MLVLATLVLGLTLLFALACLRSPYRPLQSRSIVVPPSRLLLYLYAQDWPAHQFVTAGSRMRSLGLPREAGYYEDMSHIRALEERLEREHFVQMRDRTLVRARVRVWAA